MITMPKLGPEAEWWHELHTWEPETALAFYNRTMGWEFEPIDMAPDAGYWLARKDGKPVCGIFELTQPVYDCVPSHWMTYLGVGHMGNTLAETKRAGGSVLRGPVRVEGLGCLAVMADAQGIFIGLFEPALHFEVAQAA
jgi:uncharacterized protein